jgi:hypothetical protein
MCETLDEIHDAQLAAVIARMRKERTKLGKQVLCN